MEQPQLKYGDVIRLFTTSSLVPDAQGGFVGVLKTGKNKNKLLLAIPPVPKSMLNTFTESDLTIESPDETKMGMPITYGDPIILVDNTNCTWNNKIDGSKGCLGFRERGAKGEVHVTFVKQGFYSMPVRKEDSDFALNIIASNRKRSTFNKTISHARKNGSKNFGGFMCCDGTGQALKFTVHKVPKIVKRKTKVLKKRKKSVKSEDEKSGNNVGDDGASTAEEGERTAEENERTADEGERTADEGEITADEETKIADTKEKTAGDRETTASGKEKSTNNDSQGKNEQTKGKNEPEKKCEEELQIKQKLDQGQKGEEVANQDQKQRLDNKSQDSADISNQKRESGNADKKEMETIEPGKKRGNENEDSDKQCEVERSNGMSNERKEGIMTKVNHMEQSGEPQIELNNGKNKDEQHRDGTVEQNLWDKVNGETTKLIEVRNTVEFPKSGNNTGENERIEITRSEEMKNKNDRESMKKHDEDITDEGKPLTTEITVSDIEQGTNQHGQNESNQREENVVVQDAGNCYPHKTRTSQQDVEANTVVVAQQIDKTSPKPADNSNGVIKKKTQGSSPERKRYPTVDDMDGNVHDMTHGCPAPNCCLIA